MSPSGFSGVAHKMTGSGQSWASVGARRPSPMVVCSRRRALTPSLSHAARAFRSEGSSMAFSGGSNTSNSSWFSKARTLASWPRPHSISKPGRRRPRKMTPSLIAWEFSTGVALLIGLVVMLAGSQHTPLTITGN
jgi:hypothetical protein